MTFQPLIPIGGLAGWEFLKRTRARQEDLHAASPVMKRTVETFKASLGSIQSVDDLIANRSALSVVLGAFGLQDDLDNRAFIRKVIADGTEDRNALSNRLADKRYLALATELAFLGPGGSGVAPKDIDERLATRYRASEFEIAVGKADETMRFALAFERKIPEIVGNFRSDTARWFEILGDPPTRRVIETALGLPKEFAALDIDDQVQRLQAAANQRFGAATVAELATPEMIAQITQRYLLLDQLRTTQLDMSGAAVALSLLSNRN